MAEKRDSYDTPTENPNPAKMIWKELDKKAVKEVMEAKLENIDSALERVREDVTEVERLVADGHKCEQKPRLETLSKASESNQKAISDMYKWYARGLGAVVLVLLTSGVAFVWYLSGLSYNLENNNLRLGRIEAKTDQLQEKSSLNLETLEPLLKKLADSAANSAIQQSRQPTP